MKTMACATASRTEPTTWPLRPGAILELVRGFLEDRATGRLVLRGEGGRLELRFVNGEIVSASPGSPERLGEILRRCGLIGQSDLARAVAEAERQGRRLGPVLCEMGLVRRDRVEDALRLQIRDVLFAVLFWGEGSWSFVVDDAPTPMTEDVTLRASTGQMLLEAAHHVDAPEAVREALGDLDAPVGAVARPAVRLEGVTLGPADGYVLSRSDGSRSIRQILEASPLPVRDVERSLYALFVAGVIRRLEPRSRGDRRSAPAAAPPGDAPSPASARNADLRRQVLEAWKAQPQRRTHYEVLGLGPRAGSEEIRRAYLERARVLHPDALRDPALADIQQMANAVFQRLSEAYNALRHSPSVERPPATEAQNVPSAPQAPVVHEEPAGTPLRPLADLFLEAQEHLRDGRPFEASQALEEVVVRSEGRLQRRARIFLARAYASTRRGAKQAEAELLDIVAEDPACAEAYLDLGELYRQKGASVRAMAAFRKVVALEPGNTRASAALAALGNPARNVRFLDLLMAKAR
jgi:hypothetical protein